MRAPITFLILNAALFLPPSLGLSQQTTPNAEPLSIQAIGSAEAAVERAFQFTGFEELNGISANKAAAMTSVVSLGDTTTPYLSEFIDGRRAWEITMRKIFIELPRFFSKDAGSGISRDFTMIIDSATGRFLKIYSDPDSGWESPAPLPSKKAEEYTEKWLRFPDEPPTITFKEALNNAVGCDPKSAKQITAMCVVGILDNKEVTFWSIAGHGIPAMTLPAPSGIESTNVTSISETRRTLVDAASGQWLRVTGGR